MGDGIKVIGLIIILFIAFILFNGDYNFGSSRNNPLWETGTSHTSGETSYVRNADRNNDGVVSHAEQQQSELNRVEEEIRVLEERVAEALEATHRSPYAGMVTLRRGSVTTTDRREEYVTLEAPSSNTSNITITGWRLRSAVSGRQATIPGGLYKPKQKRATPLQTIFLSPGEHAYVVTASIPGFGSFLTNKCTGYFNRLIDWTPSLRRDCPLLEDEHPEQFGITFNAFDEEEEYDECFDAIERVGRCQDDSSTFGLEKICRDFIRTYATYEGCLELHENDADFLGNEWRIGLGRNEELWRKEREAIMLLDQNGLTVDVVKY